MEANDSVGGCEKKIRELENQKRQLLRQVLFAAYTHTFYLAWIKADAYLDSAD